MVANREHLVALQILPGAVLWVELELHGSMPSLRNCGRETLSQGESSNGAWKESLQEAVSTIWSQVTHSWMEQPEILLLVPDSRVTSRYLEVPSTDPERVKNVIAFEVGEEIQLPPEEIVWDHLRFRGESEIARVLWLAARNTSIHEFLDALPAGFPVPNVVTPALIGSAALADSAMKENPGQAAILLDLQEPSATLLVQDADGLYYARSVAAATSEKGETASPKTSGFAQDLSRELTRTFFYARQRFTNITMKQVLVAGKDNESMARKLTPPPGLKLNALNLAGALGALGLNTKDTARIPAESTSLSAAAILHLTRRGQVPNLAPAAAAGTFARRLGGLAGVFSGRFLMVAVLLIALCAGTAVGSTLWRQHAIEARQEKTGELLNKVKKLEQEQKILRALQKERVPFSKMFLELADKIPQNVTMTDLNFDLKTKFTMKGKAGSNRDVENIVNMLKEMKYFKEVTVEKTAVEKEGFVFYIEGTVRQGI